MSDKLRKLLVDLIKEEIPRIVVVGQVKAVDENKLTCEVLEIESELTIYDVRLNAGKTLKKVVLIPKIDSFILMGLIGNSNQARYIVTVSEIDKVIIDAETSIIINGGVNGGLCKTTTLKQELDKNNEILTAILNVLNGAPVMEPGNGAPSALQVSLKGAVTGKTIGDFSAIENLNVKH